MCGSDDTFLQEMQENLKNNILNGSCRCIMIVKTLLEQLPVRKSVTSKNTIIKRELE